MASCIGTSRGACRSSETTGEACAKHGWVAKDTRCLLFCCALGTSRMLFDAQIPRRRD